MLILPMMVGLVIVILGISLYFFWRHLYFFRNPERKIPAGNNIVSPADGIIVYVERIKAGIIPVSRKGRDKIELNELTKVSDSIIRDGYLIGVFMSPFDVHVNRAPIAGIVKEIHHFKNNNVLLLKMWMRILLGKKDHFSRYPHILQNERNTVLLMGRFPVYVVQIADKTVNKVECWVREGEELEKGQRLGMIKMGSQVDVIFPIIDNLRLCVKTGEKVKAGETILAVY